MGAKGKDKLKLVKAEARDARKRFRELFDKTNRNQGARPADVEALRVLLRDNPAERLWEGIAGPLSVAQSFALEHSEGISPAVRLCWRERLDDIRKDLAGESPSEAEGLLAQHAALCWLRLAETEIQFTAHTAKSHTLTAGAYWDKRMSMAQRRFNPGL